MQSPELSLVSAYGETSFRIGIEVGGEELPLLLTAPYHSNLQFQLLSSCCASTYGILNKRLACSRCSDPVPTILTDIMWRPSSSSAREVLGEWLELRWAPLTAVLYVDLIQEWGASLARAAFDYMAPNHGTSAVEWQPHVNAASEKLARRLQAQA